MLRLKLATAAAAAALIALAACSSKQNEPTAAASEAPADTGQPAAADAAASADTDASAPDAASGTADASATPSSSGNGAPMTLQSTDIKVGTGPAIHAGQTAVVQYTGWLYSESAPEHKGEKFDSSRDRNMPFEFPLGAGQVIQGWDQGVDGMQVGGQRRLVIPPDLGYGARGAGGVIPPNATLVFDVELLGIK
ncbi:MAG TPA: FKBP-type peptidyl-prolyl cis-trans isomerase [Steroidobacteraceae bacterium]|nr:FKBP-type peptidyl-prolyl cis-trans isomerase [Steroidobacteraceae bacterium]